MPAKPPERPATRRKIVWEDRPRRWYEFWRAGRIDLAIAVSGIALGLTCALFPWYIFFHQDKFGIRAMRFDGANVEVTGLPLTSPQMPKDGPGIVLDRLPPGVLDEMATGTVQDEAPVEPATRSDQPFPGDGTPFKVVHIENGRAMIEDDSGLFVVERGSVLPDNSQVARIERKDSRWVLVTTDDRVIQAAE